MSIREGRIGLYLADIRPLYQEETQRYVYERLDEVRRKKADACRMPKARAASLAAGFLAQYALEQNGFAGCRIIYTEQGQPKVKTDSGGEEALPFLSLSHSGDYAVCAIADRPVGVDIQKAVPVRSRMLKHFFSEEERMRFEKSCGLDAAESSAQGTGLSGRAEEKARFLTGEAATEFFRHWTAKESCMKLTGVGMGIGFASICADLEAGIVRWKQKCPQSGVCPEEKRLWTKESGEEVRLSCRLREYPAPEGYFLAACIGTGGGECLWN